jgi:hypothetical protein
MVISKCVSYHNGVYFFNILTSKSCLIPRCFVYLCWKCALYYNGVYFFDILTSKSGPRMVYFVYFDLEMYFTPQRYIIFYLLYNQLAPHPPL